MRTADHICPGAMTSMLIYRCLIQEQEPLIESLDRDTEGVSNRMSAAMHKLQEVIKKMNFCTQMGVIVALVVVLVFMLGYTFFW